MKIFSKITMAVLALALTFAITSCGDDDGDCASCDAVEVTEQGVTFTLPAWDGCVGDDNGQGGTITQAELDDLVATYEASGANCN